MKTHPRSCILAILSGFALLSSTAHAQVPNLINYQGRVAVGTTNFNGQGSFKFALVNSNGSTTYWSHNNTSTAGSQPTGAAVSLTVTKGLYSVLLGDTSIAGMTQAFYPPPSPMPTCASASGSATTLRLASSSSRRINASLRPPISPMAP